MFRVALEASPTGMLMMDEGGRIVLVNEQIEKLFGYPRRELIGVLLEVLVPSRFREGHPHFRSGFFKEPKARPMGAGRDLYGLHKDGAEIPIEIGLNPLVMSGRQYVLSSVVDITERKRAEQAVERQSREREVLLKEVYHRVKNNLQIISSLLNLQAQQVSDTRFQSLLEESRNRVLSIGLVHELLYQSSDLARVDFSNYVGHLVGHLSSVFEGAIHVRVRADVEDVHLSVDLAVPCGLIINELATNAIKHAFPDGRSGFVDVRMRRVSPNRVALTIADNGVGLPPHVNPAQSGTLGLELVFGLCRQLQAEVQVDTPVGTSFTLTFSDRK